MIYRQYHGDTSLGGTLRGAIKEIRNKLLASLRMCVVHILRPEIRPV